MQVQRAAIVTTIVIFGLFLGGANAKADQVTVTLTSPASNSTFARDTSNATMFTVKGVATASALVANGATARVHIVVKNTNTGKIVDTDLGQITLQTLSGVNYSFNVNNLALPTGSAGDKYTVQVNVQGADFGGQSPVHDGIQFTPN